MVNVFSGIKKWVYRNREDALLIFSTTVIVGITITLIVALVAIQPYLDGLVS